MVNVHARYIDVARDRGLARPRRSSSCRPTSRSPSARRPAPGCRRPSSPCSSPTRRTPTWPRSCAATCPTSGCSSRPARATSRPSLRERYADADPPAPAAAGDHRHPARQPDGQPVGDLVRPPHDRGHRRLGGRRDPGVGGGPRGARLPAAVGRDRRPRPGRSRSTSSSTCSSTAGGWSSGRRCGCCATAGRRSTSPAAVAQFKPGLTELAASLEPVLVGRMADVVHSVEASRLTAGVPERARRAGRRCGRCCTPGSTSSSSPAPTGWASPTLAAIEWAMFDRLDLSWLWDGIGGAAPLRPLADPGPLGAARRPADGAGRAHRDGGRQRRRHRSTAGWPPTSGRSSRAQAMFTEIRRAETFDLTTLSVALRQLRNLALTAARAGDVVTSVP